MRSGCHLILPAVLVLGCGGAAGQAEPKPCGPVESELPAETRTQLLEGEFRIRFVAASGSGGGPSREVDGTLKLLPNNVSPRAADTAYAYPLFGTLDADLAAVGATAPGDIGSLDPMQPGVLVIERLTAGPAKSGRLLLRLGSLANRRDVVRFDGGYTALWVRALDSEGFAGSWESGAPMPTARGHFCATRVQPEPQ
jgi:hypothetical protein